MHQPTLSEIRGELLALRCYAAALAQVLPIGSLAGLAAAFEHFADLVRDDIGDAASAGFDRVAIALGARRLDVSLHASEQDRGQRP